ncbi:hypothetical protein HMPREF1981_02857 [Bacteroides pyogenes F0041]|uniref:Uncharacterized protein n=1 Tax=Bacteroides pyogenes F0041 TaxID=1321819 RepID=U2CBK5_9BACE|nr:hypothetical protein HMPREF1981_02857 [Bacteroides pyogenes F0041]
MQVISSAVCFFIASLLEHQKPSQPDDFKLRRLFVFTYCL